MLFCDQTGSYPRPQMLVQELGHVCRTDIFPSLQEPSRQYAYCIGVRVDEIGHNFCEFDLIFKRRDLAFRPWQQRRETVDIVGMDLGDMGVRDDDKGEVTEGLDAVGKACREDRERKIRRGEQL
jgi:hypothetical protein